MKSARLVVLAIALASGGAAMLLVGRIGQAPQTVVQVVEQKPSIETVEVLVAGADIAIGNVVTEQAMSWHMWPKAQSGGFIVREARPTAVAELSGAVVRTPFFAGEPIKEAKLVKANGSGFMSAILSTGMRAVSTEISPETGAGGFILPNDRVDVILTRKDSAAERRGQITFLSETLIENVRVLAIDQTVEEKNGLKVVVGKIATLELAPAQAENLTLYRQQGILHLALRSLSDSRSDTVVQKTASSPGVVMMRYDAGWQTSVEARR